MIELKEILKNCSPTIGNIVDTIISEETSKSVVSASDESKYLKLNFKK